MEYPLPGFLAGKGSITHAAYVRWLNCKSDTLRRRDLKRKMPYAAQGSNTLYKQKLHEAVTRCGGFDPYTGGPLRWELIGSWDDERAKKEGRMYKKKFAAMPTADHSNPDRLAFEICSWQVNDCKSDLTPAEFIGLCGKVAAYRSDTPASPFIGSKPPNRQKKMKRNRG